MKLHSFAKYIQIILIFVVVVAAGLSYLPVAKAADPVGTVRIEAGGTANFTDHLGSIWLAESGFSGGGVVDRGNIAIANTLDARIYQTEHYGMTAFAYPVANGSYQINLHFAETYTGITAAGQRVFSVNVEGTAINNIDIFAQAGGANRALIKTVTVNVVDGQLNITFAATANSAAINGIEIIPTSGATATPSATATRTSTSMASSTATRTSTPNPVGVRIEAGGTANFTDHLGSVWLAESGFSGGGVVDRGNIAIANTLDARIYQTEHYAMTAFAYPVANGSYQINLHFAETYTGITAAGQRVFSVNVEGTAINNIDIFAQAGGANRALIKTVTVNVVDGQLNITFTATTNSAAINGIEIIPGGATATPTLAATVTKTSTLAATATRTSTLAATATRTLTRTATLIPALTATVTKTSTRTATATNTPTSTGSIDLTHLPLGDGHISTSPAVGWVWSCQTQFNGGGAFADGPWINSDGTFNVTTKALVDGAITWPSQFTIVLNGQTRSIVGNNLPKHTTGRYPIASNDDAYLYDRNPNSISAQTVQINLPANPQVALQSTCLSQGRIGVMLTGSYFFNALDAQGRDAVAHELQDGCGGHPEASGAYHYHDLSNCATDTSTGHSTLVGYALDGFGIFGYRGENGQEMTNAQLDGCHGHTHAILWDGQTVVMYHYHTTHEYPYTLGCYKGTP